MRQSQYEQKQCSDEAGLTSGHAKYAHTSVFALLTSSTRVPSQLQVKVPRGTGAETGVVATQAKTEVEVVSQKKKRDGRETKRRRKKERKKKEEAEKQIEEGQRTREHKVSATGNRVNGKRQAGDYAHTLTRSTNKK